METDVRASLASLTITIICFAGCHADETVRTRDEAKKAVSEPTRNASTKQNIVTRTRGPRETPTCEELKDFKEHEFDPCVSTVPGAPPVVPTRAWLYEILASVYAELCPQGGCSIEVDTKRIVRDFDYRGLQQALAQRLSAAGEVVAFQGHASGEIFLVTRPIPTAAAVPRSYRQLRLIGRTCGDYIEWTDPCGFFGDASLLRIHSVSPRSRITFQKDALSVELEEIMLDRINVAVGLKRRGGG